MSDGFTEAVIRDLQREQDNKEHLIRMLQQQIEHLKQENERLRFRLEKRLQHYDND